MLISLNLLAAWLFAFFVVSVALVISILLIRDSREKQKAYAVFSGYLGEFQVILSKEGNLLDATPRYISDPLFERICQEKNFRNILSTQEYARLQDYAKGLASYPDIPFVFSFDCEQGLRWYELRAYIQKKQGNDSTVFLIKNVTMDVESRNQRDELKQNIDMLLQNTGDFLWTMDVDSRRFTLLTPLVDEEGRVVPRSVGTQDVRTMMPARDYEIFEKMLNSRIVEFRASGHDIEGNRGLSLRLLRPDGSLCWYFFGGRLVMEEGANMVFRGTARRMELLQDNPVLEDDAYSNVLLSSALALPDVRVFWVDRDYKVIGCNQAFSLAFGRESPKSIEGRRLLEIVRPKYFSFFHRYLSEVFERGRAVSWKGVFGAVDSLLWVNAVPLKNLDGETNKILAAYMLLNAEEFTENS